MMKNLRQSGILFHPTSLPNRHGIGDLGAGAFTFIDFLSEAGAKLWQILPLGPTGYGNSPYSARSSFAGNELLISLDALAEQGLLSGEELTSHPGFDTGRVDYEHVSVWKMGLLKRAAGRFITDADPASQEAYDRFCTAQAFWLDDYALFMSIYEEYQDSRWYSVWEHGIGYREPGAIEAWTMRKQAEIRIWKVLQYLFSIQWKAVRDYANHKGIQLIGDIPIFVASDSVDTWSNLHLFKTDEEGRFSAISGVPPDFFSETGQLWGTPVYDWEVNQAEGFSWWLKRIDAALELTDIIRIDHFRGFAAYWEVPAGERTAENGSWVKAPGKDLFDAVRAHRGDVPIIAEDLGVMTPDVEELRDSNGLPGMKVFQFSFDYLKPGRLDPTNDFLPHNYIYNCVAYTGTHDNNTTAGWYDELPEEYRDIVRRYLARDDHDIAWSMIRVLMSSVAKYVIIPMQDLLGLGSGSRMNTPATAGPHNWSWRLPEGSLTASVSGRFREMVELYGRIDLQDEGREEDQ